MNIILFIGHKIIIHVQVKFIPHYKISVLFLSFNSCICIIVFFVADVHMLILYNCYSNSRLKSSLELMFILYVSSTQNKSCLVFLSCSCLDIILLEIPEVKVFSKLHAVSGYWQIKHSQERQKFCTFNTPLKRYSRTRLPYGLKSTREVNQRSVSNMVPDRQ